MIAKLVSCDYSYIEEFKEHYEELLKPFGYFSTREERYDLYGHRYWMEVVTITVESLDWLKKFMNAYDIFRKEHKPQYDGGGIIMHSPVTDYEKEHYDFILEFYDNYLE